MALNLDTNVRLSAIHTIQAIRHSKVALSILSPSDPIKELYYQEAIYNLTLAYDGIVALPIVLRYPPVPVHPGDPISPVDPINVLKQSNIKGQLSLVMTYIAIIYIDQAVSLTQDIDDPASLHALLLVISSKLGFARSALIQALEHTT